MSPRINQTPLSGRDRRHFKKNMETAERVYRSKIRQSESARRFAEQKTLEANWALCEAWNAALFMGGPAQPSPTIFEAMSVGCDLLKVQCSRCGRSIDVRIVEIRRVTVVTDVVRENNQTYRLGYSEMCKDGSKMGVGCPEYVLLLRKPQTDRSKGYGDVRVAKDKDDYSLSRWQLDAHAFWRSSGDRLLPVETFASKLRNLDMGDITAIMKAFSQEVPYDHEYLVRLGDELGDRLPKTFMALGPVSDHDAVWTDVNRMGTLNGEQVRRNVEMHICPLQFDIVDRCIDRFSMKDDVVFDPFGGLMTVPYRAMLKGRFGAAVELNKSYFRDGLHYLRQAEAKTSVPSLFDLLGNGKDVA